MKTPNGYMMIDDAFSPGVPEDIAVSQGFDPKLLRGGQLFEADTYLCVHCGVAVLKCPPTAPRLKPRGTCLRCNGTICDPCVAARELPGYTHASLEHKCDAILDQAAKGTKGDPFAAFATPKIFVTR